MRGHYWSKAQYRWHLLIRVIWILWILIVSFSLEYRTSAKILNELLYYEKMSPKRKRRKYSELSKISGRAFFDVLRFKRYRNLQSNDIVLFIFLSRLLTCGMIDNLLLKSLSPSSRILMPSISILPLGSANLNNVERREDLPAPVRPTTPIWRQEQAHHCCLSSTVPFTFESISSTI